MALSLPEQLSQLDAARQIVLADPVLYPEIVNGVLPIINANARVELKRWGADFLAETFASPVVTVQAKQQMGLQSLQTLKELLDMPGPEDPLIIKGVVEAAASLYEIIFKYIIENPSDVPVWNTMAAIKSNILKRWDTAVTGVKICCIKFVQKVVQVQTPGPIADPRRPMQSETSIALVPRDHPLIPPPRLEPEASGLLDRMLDVFNHDPIEPILINATLNCMGILTRARQSIANKIVSAVLSFDPFKLANAPMTPKSRVQIKSMERTTRSFLMNIYRRNENSPFAGRIKQYIDRINQSRIDILDETVSRKRGLPTEPTDGLDPSKRRRIGAELPEEQGYKLTPNAPNSLAQLFTLTADSTLASFDVKQLPQDLVISITQGLLAHINQQELDRCVNLVRSRFLYLSKASQANALGDDEEDYEPDFDEPSEDREQILNRADALPLEDAARGEPELALGPFELPQPPALSAADTRDAGQVVVGRVFGMLRDLEEPSASSKRQKLGLNRLAGNTNDRDAWLTFITRLATRASAGLDQEAAAQEDTDTAVTTRGQDLAMADTIREGLWRYVGEDFRARISTAIAWLNEEWFNDRIQQQHHEQACKASGAPPPPPPQNYEKWVQKMLDAIMPYLDARDKLLIRFLSEIPVVSEQVLERVKSLARDPERVDLAVRSLHYLIIAKPPARESALDAMEDLWRNFDDARIPASKVLQKWRPDVVPPPTARAASSTPGPGNPPPPTTASSNVNHMKTESAMEAQGGNSTPASPTGGLPVAAAG